MTSLGGVVLPHTPLSPSLSDCNVIHQHSSTQTCRGLFRFLECPPNEDGKVQFYNGARKESMTGIPHNPSYVEKDVRIGDIRDNDILPNFEKDGLEFIEYRRPLKVTPSETETIMAYLTEITEIMKSRLGAENVICYDYKFRESDDSKKRPDILGLKQERSEYGPASDIAHVDITPEGAPNRLRRHLSPEEVVEYLDAPTEWRIRIINVWRPLNVVRDRPLAFCLPRSVQQQDLIPVKYHTAEDYIGEIYNLRYNEGQEWVYLADQTPEEIALFLGYDSRPSRGIECCPHSSFPLRTSPHPDHHRRSIEARLIVVSKI